ncbi:MAG: hypothetical protein LUD73_07480 [Lachnospiraceae bacterium]|nr:hypothetical protein [Lachnospiraceae bacterium]
MKEKDIKLNAYVRTVTMEFRRKNQLTQEQMAEGPNNPPRTYHAPQEGHCGFSGQTICRLLVLLSAEDRLAFVHGIETGVWDQKS